MACTHEAIKDLTPQDFKDKFFRGFKYLITWDALDTYNTGNIVLYAVNGLFYSAISNGIIGTVPTDTGSWTEISDSIDTYVQDRDITEAYAEACISYNAELFGEDDEDVKLGYFYISAHYLVHDLRSNGVESVATHFVSSTSVGSVSESYSVPQWMLEDRILSFYTTTSYGIKYLNFIVPHLSGVVGIVSGGTNA